MDAFENQPRVAREKRRERLVIADAEKARAKIAQSKRRGRDAGQGDIKTKVFSITRSGLVHPVRPHSHQEKKLPAEFNL
ncbi:MAG: hypothetical protein M5R36_00715 [Deltaproteobacteria bacterium]|nr:hypothetical protein [Deltaproteobacteria bacterium]